ncbi:unnamed protein product [Rotaria sp. Silwood1]|nr:unnamed protein product [Rotaria sp. Silwood1]
MVLSNYSSSDIIKRKAINAFGYLSSLYDGYRDCLIVQVNRNVPKQSFKSSRSAKCIIINGNSDASHNILRTIDIENDLRLSLLLNLTPKIGIAAILNYSYRINEYTRFLYYSWIDREEQVSNEIIRNLKLIDSIKPEISATHIITGINYGIDVLVVLQLPSETGLISEIDHTLQKITRSLSNDNDIVSLLTIEENDRLRKITNITIYSNIPDLTALNNISIFLDQLQKIQKKFNSYPPITYFLQPLTVVYSQHMRNNIKFNILPSEVNNNLEQYILHKREMIINFTKSFPKDLQKFFSGYLDVKLFDAYKQSLHMMKKYLFEIDHLSELIIGFRNGHVKISAIDDVLSNKKQIILKNERTELVQNLNDLEAKANLINDLFNQNFRYCNVVERDINKYDNENTIRMKLIETDNRDRVLCSDDTLNQNNQEQFNKLRFYLIQEQQRNSNLRLIYADFSYCSYKLHNMFILPSNNNTNLSNQKSYSSIINSPIIVSLPRREQPFIPSTREVHQHHPSATTDEIINILLLGETGVGKSTFINAFANYLRSNSLEQAQFSESIVFIPISFDMTIGNNFEERTVKFGNMNDLYNEDFNHPGQSVTQRCKSYIFNIERSDNNNRRKIRIIDTPGFGDTRGLDQDEHNMEHTLQYINNLKHLNAICFLLKPNVSRLNIFFRTCLIQLFSLLAPTARNNIIFCFTNARSTFYTPGNTAPLLKAMLASSSMNDISFKKENTFCFDSEAFLYLVALRNQISFTHEEKHEYEMSWSTSVKESHRLIDYIRNNCIPYYIQSEFQSIKRAQFEISYMIRPILETIRNILRTIILSKMNMQHISIELCPKPVLRSTAVCFSCKPHIVRIGPFWIASDSLHEFQNKCYTCSCASHFHMPIDYILDYKSINNPSSYRLSEINDMLHRIYFASAELSHFLMHGACSTKDDQFMLGLMQMIRTEKNICAERKSNQMNMQLITELEKVQYEYEQRKREVTSNQDRKTLAIIYGQIKMLRSYPEICEQMLAVEQGQKEIMKQTEVVL